MRRGDVVQEPPHPVAGLAASLALAACAQKPLIPYSADTPPLALVPAAQAGVQDKRGALSRDLLRRAGGAPERGSRLPAAATKP